VLIFIRYSVFITVFVTSKPGRASLTSRPVFLIVSGIHLFLRADARAAVGPFFLGHLFVMAADQLGSQ